MMRAAWAVARADLRRWIRSPALIAATLIPAVGMSATVLALTFAVGRQPVALVRSGYGPLSERIVQSLQQSDGFFLRERTPEQAARDLAEQWVCAVITIPKNFDQDALDGRGVFEVAINNVDLDFSDDVRRSVSEAVVKLDAPELASLGGGDEEEGGRPAAAIPPSSDEGAGALPGDLPVTHRNPYRIDVVETDLRRPDVSFLAYQMVPVLALLALTAGALVVAISISADREGGMLRMLRVSPARRLDLVAGHLAGGTLGASMLLGIVVAILASIGLLRAAPERWCVVAAILVATAMGSTGLGVLVGMITRRMTSTVLLGVNAASASFLLGGGFTTVAFLPAWIQSLARVTPTFYAVEALREALFYQSMPTAARSLVVLAGAAIASVLVGAALLSFGEGGAPEAEGGR